MQQSRRKLGPCLPSPKTQQTNQLSEPGRWRLSLGCQGKRCRNSRLILDDSTSSWLVGSENGKGLSSKDARKDAISSLSNLTPFLPRSVFPGELRLRVTLSKLNTVGLFRVYLFLLCSFLIPYSKGSLASITVLTLPPCQTQPFTNLYTRDFQTTTQK